jgi:hypothetical protein
MCSLTELSSGERQHRIGYREAWLLHRRAACPPSEAHLCLPAKFITHVEFRFNHLYIKISWSLANQFYYSYLRICGSGGRDLNFSCRHGSSCWPSRSPRLVGARQQRSWPWRWSVLGHLLALAALTCRARSLATLACAPDLGGRRWKPIISPQRYFSRFFAHWCVWGRRFQMRKRFLPSKLYLLNKLPATTTNCWVVNTIKRDRNYI